MLDEAAYQIQVKFLGSTIEESVRDVLDELNPGIPKGDARHCVRAALWEAMRLGAHNPEVVLERQRRVQQKEQMTHEHP
jgi:hypothetical protein